MTDSSFYFTEDYRIIRHKGQTYFPTKRQALVIKVLHEARQEGLDGLTWHEIYRRTEGKFDGRITDVFRSGDPCRDLIIIGPRRGVYRLNF